MAASTSCLRQTGAEMRSTSSSQASSGLISPYQLGHVRQQSPHSQVSCIGLAPSQPSSSSLPSSSAPTLDQTASDSGSASASPTAGPSRPSHTCPNCAKSFSRPAKLHAHLLIHSHSRPHACSHRGCDVAYRTKSKLLDHERKSHLDAFQQEQEKKFVCTHALESGQTCGRRFWTKQHLLRHVEGVHDAGATDAEREAGDGDGDGDDGRRSGQYECTEPGCTQAFSKRKRLRRHVWEAHTDHAGEGADTADADANADAELAQGDEARAGTPAALRNKLPFPCSFPDCMKRFPTNSKRKSHFKTHAQDRYTCALPHPTSSPAAPAPAQASATSSSSSALPPPPGGIPSLLTFPTWSALQAHMREVHPPTCHYEACDGKVFKNRENLKMHLRRHEDKEHEEREKQKERERDRDGELKEPGQGQGQEWCEASSDEEEESKGSKSLRVFHCTWRPETGATNGNLNDPTTTSPSTTTPATSAPTAATAPCSKSFKSSHSLQTHIRVAHLKDRPFKCLCGKAYGHKHLLKRHEVKCAVLLAELQQQQQEAGDDGEEEADGEHEHDTALASELDEDEEDDVFRQGGGALPEEYRESASALARYPVARSSVISRRAKRKRGEVFHDAADGDGEGEQDQEGAPSIVDLLTGRGYAVPAASAATGTASAAPSSLASQAQAQKQKHTRRKRPRALPCPWSRLPASPISASAPADTSTCPSSPVAPSISGDTCPFHFARLYDVARHLRGAHGVELSQGEVRGLYDEGELAGLPLPRGKRRRVGDEVGEEE